MRTIKDVARLAGVSIATVSNVFNGKGRVGMDTRARVLWASRTLGYVPNHAARELVIKRTELLGVMFPYSSVGDWSSPDQPSDLAGQLIAGVEKAVRAAGLSLVLTSYEADMNGSPSLPPPLLNRRLDGLFVVGGVYPESFFRMVRELVSPLVFIGVTPMDNVDAVQADNRQAAQTATQHLFELGHRVVGLINGPDITRTSTQKLEGYMAALAAAGVAFDPRLVAAGDFGSQSGYECARQLLSLVPRPTGLFVADDLMAVGALHAARDLGLSVPGDLAVVGFGNSPLGLHVEPPLTTISIPAERVGFLAVQRLLERLAGANDEPVTISVSTRLVVRDSCGASQRRS